MARYTIKLMSESLVGVFTSSAHWPVLGMPSRVVSGWILGCATRIFDNFADLQSFLTRTYAQRFAANIAREVQAIAARHLPVRD